MARRTRLLMSTVAAVGVATMAGAVILLAHAEPWAVPLAANQMLNPCAAKNPCAAVNPCNPCAVNPCNPCAPKLLLKKKLNPCAAVNPCAAANPCAVNPAAANPCAANPCAVNPCAPKKAN